MADEMTPNQGAEDMDAADTSADTSAESAAPNSSEPAETPEAAPDAEPLATLTAQQAAGPAPMRPAPTPQQAAAPAAPEAPGSFFHTMAHALAGGLMASALGPKETTDYQVDSTGKMIPVKTQMTSGDRIRHMVAGALSGMAAGSQVHRGQGVGAGIGAGFMQVQNQQAQQDQMKQKQAAEDYERQQQQTLHNATLAHENALTTSTYFNLKRQGQEALQGVLDQNRKDFDDLNSADLPPDVQVQEMSEKDLQDARANNPRFAAENLVKPIGWQPVLGPNGEPTMDANGNPVMTMQFGVISGLHNTNGNMPITQAMADSIHKYVPNSDSIVAGQSIPIRKWSQLSTAVASGKKDEVAGWNDAKRQMSFADGKWQEQNSKTHEWREYTGPITTEMAQHLASIQKPGTTPPEISSQIGEEPTTAKYRGKTYGSVEEAKTAWGKDYQNIKEAEASAGGVSRAEAFGRNRSVQVLDTQNGNRPAIVTAGDAEDNPDRYVPAGEAAKALPKTALINDIRESANNVRTNLDVLNSPLLSKQRAALGAALADPNSTAETYMQALPKGALDEQGQQFVADLFNLREQAMAMRSVLGAGGGSEDVRKAILATLPSVGSPSSQFGAKQIDNLLQSLDRLERGVPTVPLKGQNPPGRTAPGAPKLPPGVPVDATHVYRDKQGNVQGYAQGGKYVPLAATPAPAAPAPAPAPAQGVQ